MAPLNRRHSEIGENLMTKAEIVAALAPHGYELRLIADDTYAICDTREHGEICWDSSECDLEDLDVKLFLDICGRVFQ